MKQRVLFLIAAFVFWAQGFSQTTAYNAPSILQCNYEIFDLTVQTPIILGPQNPSLFTVDYFTTNADAQANVNPIPNPSAFGIGGSMFITARVTNISDQTFDTSGFFITVLYPFAPELNDVTACDAYTLPALQSGDYYTSPGGSGQQLFPGQPVTSSMTVYVYDWIETCSDESSFEVTIISAPALPEFQDVYSCDPYVLPNLSVGAYYADQAGTIPITFNTVTQSMTVYVISQSGPAPSCTNSTSFNVTIGTTPANNNVTPLIECSPENYGFAYFDLTSKIEEITMGVAGFDVSFYETTADAEAHVNEIANSTAYQNIVIYSQTISVRISSVTDNCYSVVTMQLVVNPCTNNTVTGTITFDGDNNGCTASDSQASNVPVIMTNGNQVQYAYTNANGDYTFSNVQEGVNYISPVAQAGIIVAPTSYTLTVAGTAQDFTGNNFCLTAIPDANAGIMIYPNNSAIPGFSASYTIYIHNLASTALNGTVTLSFDDDKLNFSSASQAVVGQTLGMLTFNYTNLMPYSGQAITVNFTVNPPPTVNSGNVLSFTANVTTNVADTNMSDNTFMWNQTVVNSYDPNDISVLEGEFITEGQIDDYLHYIVRFQNTGDANATNIRVENNLDPKLDWSTFVPVTASHMFQAERSGSQVTFNFNGIDLPASDINEPASHGYLVYKVKPAGEWDGSIDATANIFFDYNAPIVTNTVSTWIIYLNVAENGLKTLQIVPNPASGQIAIQHNGLEDFEITIYDLQGKAVIQSMANNAASIDISKLQAGMYIVNIVSGNESVTKKLVVK